MKRLEFDKTVFEQTGHMSFLDAVRTLRKERDISFQQAKDEVIAFFEKKGWEHPFQKGK
jgi:hypothetical protein